MNLRIVCFIVEQQSVTSKTKKKSGKRAQKEEKENQICK